ncbi:MAG TPA: DNA adenine methylase [Acidiferrobacter sp.]|nr:DNA adenine methylase [Acidiferrobacter sp.]
MSLAASPLRYPGGKTCLLDLTSKFLQVNRLQLAHYAEPYAGGCGLALSLLYGGYVGDIHINDIDPSIWSFWHCVLNDNDAFIALIEETPITVDEWLKQREIHRQRDTSDPLRLGFSAFFLNRTNRSGIIKDAGVIGGLDQAGNYKMDCRFNRGDLTRRVRRVWKYRDRIHLSNMDAIKFLNRCDKDLPAESFLFIDPPYYKKGATLYTNFYQPEDHAVLAQRVTTLNRNWIVTYDDVLDVRKLYKGRRQYCFDINYSLQEKRVGTELLIVSKGLKVPEAIKERQVNTPQYRAA